MFAHTKASSNFDGATYCAASCNTDTSSLFAAAYGLAQAYSTPSLNTGADSIFAAPHSTSAPVAWQESCQQLLSLKRMHLYEVKPRKDNRGIDLVSDVLPFCRLWYDSRIAQSATRRTVAVHMML